jgi:uncharacterized protein (DUF983 family)
MVPERTGFWRKVGRGFLLRCPRCGVGRVFKGFFAMAPACPECGLDFHPEHGYYVGAMYLNYGATVAIALPVALLLLGRFSAAQLLAPFIVFSILFPVLSFRWSRSLWLAVETHIRSATSDR